MEKITLFWFRRDLRLKDNTGLFQSLLREKNVLPFFIFDRIILDKLDEKSDPRVEFIHSQVSELKAQLEQKESSLLVRYGKPQEVFSDLLKEFDLQSVYTNRDYEPYAKERDSLVKRLLDEQGVRFLTFKDQVIFESAEILNGSGEFYKVFTPFSKIWLAKFSQAEVLEFPSPDWGNLFRSPPLPAVSLQEIGFERSVIRIPPNIMDEQLIGSYDQVRNFPATKGTTRLGIHLRFGTISIRRLAKAAAMLNATFLKELIWREFYMMILDPNPRVVDQA